VVGPPGLGVGTYVLVSTVSLTILPCASASITGSSTCDSYDSSSASS
jgi:hypothetical protein